MDTMDAVSGCDYCDHENGEIEAETEEAPLPKKLVPLVRRKKKYRMIRFCCVPGCSGKASRMRAGFVLHSFPQPKDKFMRDGKWVNRREEWLRMVGLSTKTEVTKSMFVCTKHFEREDYFNPDLDDNRRSLKRDAIPSMNLPELPQEIPQKRLHMVWMPAREGREVVESLPQDQSLVTVKTEVTDNGHLGAPEESSLREDHVTPNCPLRGEDEFTVDENCLLQLFRQCSTCRAACSVSLVADGNQVMVTATCSNTHQRSWTNVR
ncbi:hypothetical protein IscW_ISCW015122 [Ixodes scapularis]|uniref:THAP-type domain-containing protein n=1 Tax=Ixodes scapularis TaxID=6945 RepID=B7QNC5_IXOSC|nr:hypothetical protein IscW_ISCW015122 [Ixodes scapularis]|eukprot:XP_002416430.1 hypothetical protein IscW_ISCW015122 [Ixodes scapularis]